LEKLRRNLNALEVRTFRQALELVLEGGDSAQEQRLVSLARASASALREELAAIEGRIGEQVGQPLGLLAPLRHVAASAVGFCLAGAVGLGCQQDKSERLSDPSTLDDTDSATESEPACQDEESMRARLEKELPCFTGSVNVDENRIPSAYLSMWPGGGSSYPWTECNDSHAGTALAAQATALLAQPLSCEPDLWFDVDGGAKTELAAMAAAASSCTELIEGLSFPEYAITLDHEGKVTQVEAREGASTEEQEAAQCLAEVLVGLSFPCLSDFRICPEYIIAE
jgi:hypothetical protein